MMLSVIGSTKERTMFCIGTLSLGRYSEAALQPMVRPVNSRTSRSKTAIGMGVHSHSHKMACPSPALGHRFQFRGPLTRCIFPSLSTESANILPMRGYCMLPLPLLWTFDLEDNALSDTADRFRTPVHGRLKVAPRMLAS